jgi:hypothetical protein
MGTHTPQKTRSFEKVDGAVGNVSWPLWRSIKLNIENSDERMPSVGIENARLKGRASVVKSIIVVVIFFMMTSLALATTHHKKKHPKPKPTPTKSVQLEPMSRHGGDVRRS